MFYKIDDKFYIKTVSYYKEVEFNGTDFSPSQKENTRLYDVDESKVIPYTFEEAIKEVKKEVSNKKTRGFKHISED